MAEKFEDGGAAFPANDGFILCEKCGEITACTWRPGMSFCDYVVVHILEGMIASCPIVDRTKVSKKKWVKVAYDFADALIAERRKRGG